MKTKFVFIISIVCGILWSDSVVAKKTVLIVGGGSGIGKALVSLYHKNGYHVYATYFSSRPQVQHPHIRYQKINLLSDAAIQDIKDFVGGESLDIVVYNAARLGKKSYAAPNLDRQDWVNTFIVNTIAPTRLAFALLPSLIPGNSKYAVITSRRGSKTVNIRDELKGRYSYRTSKSALNSAMVALSADLADYKIPVLMIHPGRVSTKMTRFDGMPASKSAQYIYETIAKLGIEDTGRFIDAPSGVDLPW